MAGIEKQSGRWRSASPRDPTPTALSPEQRLTELLANDGFRKLPSPYVAFARSCAILILDKRSRMRFPDSVHWKRVSRRQNVVVLGSQTKFVVFFSVAFGIPTSRPRA
jgi:hypothetical protein